MPPAEEHYDVFLSHAAADKPVVRALAERLRADNIKVWFDEWCIQPGDHISYQISQALDRSSILVPFMSANYFQSGWGLMEGYAVLFSDPLNKDRRFIPLRLDSAELPSSLAPFAWLDWRDKTAQDTNYSRLRSLFHPASDAKPPPQLESQDQAQARLIEKIMSLGHTAPIRSVAFSPDGKYALSGSEDKTVRVWEAGTGKCVRVLEGHSASVLSVAWSGDGQQVVSGSLDNTVRVWEAGTGKCVRVLEGHRASVWSVAWSGDGQQVVSGSDDNTVRVWEAGTGKCVRVLAGHRASVLSVAWSGDGQQVVSGSEDKTVRVWEAGTGKCVRVLEGHRASVLSVAWSGDGQQVVSGSLDNTVRVWEAGTGKCVRVLEGHSDRVWSVAWSGDGQQVLSGAANGIIRVWKLADELPQIASPASGRAVASPVAKPAQVAYTNAKVLIVGDSGVGKTGLSNRLARDLHEDTESTDGAWATHWPLQHDTHADGVDREIWLWDFAGQVDYRLVHQLYMDDTAAAVLVFNPQNENLFEGLGHWDRDLQKASRKPFAKLLAAGRIDRGGLVVSADSIDKFIASRGFRAPLHLTSAKTEDGCAELKQAIAAAIDWQNIPITTSPALYHRMKREILALRDQGMVLIRLAELKQRMEVTLSDESFDLAQLEAVIGLLSGPGMIQRLDFGGFILLRPEVLSRYAAATVRKVRNHPQEMGCILEEDLLAGDLDYQDFTRLPREEEAVVLRALLETFVSRAWCLRQPCDGTAILTFPSYFRRNRTDQPDHPSVLVTYRFDGPVDDIYATLVVRLHHTLAFDSSELWKDAADFKTQTGQKLGFTLIREGEGTHRLEIYLSPEVDKNSSILFQRYVHEHLRMHAQSFKRLRQYSCSNKECESFGLAYPNRAAIDKALAPGGKGRVFCPECGESIELHDAIEQKFESLQAKEAARKADEEVQTKIDTESLELILVGHAATIAAEAGQIFHPYHTSNHGIDSEIEFKDDQGRPTGKRVYLLLKAENTYVIGRRLHTEPSVLRFKETGWLEYWRQLPGPVMLVTRTTDKKILWMNITAALPRESSSANPLYFDGEPFDAPRVRQLRDRILNQS